jgi:hypothetical protein
MTMGNILTFSTAVALPDVTRAAGASLFESRPGGTNPNIVRVLSPNRRKLFYLGFTFRIFRPPRAEPGIPTFGEPANGAPAPVTAWYPVGSNSGCAFMYR